MEDAVTVLEVSPPEVGDLLIRVRVVLGAVWDLPQSSHLSVVVTATTDYYARAESIESDTWVTLTVETWLRGRIARIAS